MEDPPLVDPERLRALRDAYGDVARKLLDVYDAGAATTIAGLRAALGARDADEVRRLAHRLKGSARNVGATTMADLAAALEQVPPDAATTLDRLDAARAPSCAALRDALSR